MDTDTIMAGAETLLETGIEPRKFVVSIDFGTTCSSVAYVGLNNDSQRARIGLGQVELVDKFPSGILKHFSYNDVPTEISYRTTTSRQTEAQDTPWDNDESSSDNESNGSDTTERNASTSKAARRPKILELSAAPPRPHSVSWGFEVQEQMRKGELDSGEYRHLRRFKLMLDNSEITKEIRNTVVEQCRALKDRHLIKEDLDVIADYLDQLFRCTKQKLVRSEGYQEHESIEFVLCVPAAWKGSALRDMQLAMSTAIKNSGLGTSRGNSIENLFLVSEPEAAATCMLADKNAKVKLGQTFIVLDAGGGTVDAVTYKVDRVNPLRLTEVAESKGELCGSSFINERFQKLLEKRLKNEHYLEDGGESLAQIIDSLVVDFERRDKVLMDGMTPDEGEEYKLKISGLRTNDRLGFRNGRLRLTSREIDKRLFRRSLEGVAKLMNNQLDAASDYQKIILMGGFGQSARLERHLRADLNRRFRTQQPELVVPQSQWSAAAVARGGVLRALRKEDGPTRQLQSSFGFLRTERYGEAEEHTSQVPEKDKIDGHQYIYNTIDWVLQKGDSIPAEHVILRRVENTFGFQRGKLICSETLYVSDLNHPSHYHHKHPENKGAQVAGRVVVDLTYLRDQGKINHVSRPGMLPYWKISFTLRIIVSGRNLRYEVIPDGEDGIKGGEQVSIAAAFLPGTE